MNENEDAIHPLLFYTVCYFSVVSVVFFYIILIVDTQPDTHEVDQSEIRTQILLATASTAPKCRHSFTHMLTEVSPQMHILKTWKYFRFQTKLQRI